jgi:L-arabinose transport system substrate-binding protein
MPVPPVKMMLFLSEVCHILHKERKWEMSSLKKHSRSVIVIVMIIAALAAAVAVKKLVKSPGGSGKITIGFLVKQPEVSWFQDEWRFADQAAGKYGFKLIKIGVPDGEKTLAAIDTLAASGAQGFVICTPDPSLGPAIVARAKSHGLKVLAVDDQFIGPGGTKMTEVPYLGISPFKIGEKLGRELFQQMQARGWGREDTAAMLATYDELDTTKQRTDGAAAALTAAGFPAEKIFRAPNKATDLPSSFDAANTVLTMHADVKHWLIAGYNDNAVLGAVRATENQGFAPAAVIGIGINGTDCISELEKEQPTGFHGSYLLNPYRHGFETAEMVYQWVTAGVEPPAETLIEDVVLLTRENFRQVLKERALLEKPPP